METLTIKKAFKSTEKITKGQFKDEKAFLDTKQKRFHEVFGKVNWKNIK
ncbi:MAG: hypothetical protein U5M51_02230 [Emticicia sp.]|nr:hypothetical protein [Emticicia sp.]